MSTNLHDLSLKDALDALSALPAILTLHQAAGVLGIATVTVRRRIQSGDLRALRTHAARGGRLRLLKQDVARLLTRMATSRKGA